MQVSHEYCEGIKEGRQYLNKYSPDAAEIVEIISNLKSTMRGFNAGPVKDMLRGELDFWKHYAR